MTKQTCKIEIDSTEFDSALKEATRFSDSLNLTQKERFHLRLLTEETFEMMKSIAKEFTAVLWIEEENKLCTLHLDARASLNESQKRELISISSDKQNFLNLSIMERVKAVIENVISGMLDESLIADGGLSERLYIWNMEDEYEKYIIASIADEVRVGISRDKAELIITKDFGHKKLRG